MCKSNQCCQWVFCFQYVGDFGYCQQVGVWVKQFWDNIQLQCIVWVQGDYLQFSFDVGVQYLLWYNIGVVFYFVDDDVIFGVDVGVFLVVGYQVDIFGGVVDEYYFFC